jgi:hypothetical protein
MKPFFSSTKFLPIVQVVLRIQLALQRLGKIWLLGLFFTGFQEVLAQEKREWIIERMNREDAEKQRLTDSLMRSSKGNSLLWFSYGNYFIPESEAVSETNTYFNMRSSHKVFSLEYDYFLTNNLAAGIELGFHTIKQTTNMTGTRIKGGGGLVATGVIQLKYFFKPLRASPNRRLYVFLGGGGAQTTAVSINATIDFNNPGRQPNPKVFTQTSNTINAGLGLYHRLNKWMAADLAVRYFHSASYSPYIGSVRSFSPFQVDIKLGGVLNGGFRRMEKKRLN